MKLSEHENVSRVISVLKNINMAIQDSKDFIESVKERGPDAGGIEDFVEYGHSSYVHINSDGSGPGINMAGCYVATEIAVAAHEVLIKKREILWNWLTEHGVTVDA